MKDKTTIASADSMRLKDLQLTAELLIEANTLEHCARERIADKHVMRKAVITTESDGWSSSSVSSFSPDRSGRPHGGGQDDGRARPRVIEEIEQFAGILRDASDRDNVC
ncbi:MAG: LysR family transcriptional regulator [Mesorhizobium sp.]|nr:MAG: LysR family transcriptional regulator [Mesorhizobium sp.]